jgi:hypothetical protein
MDGPSHSILNNLRSRPFFTNVIIRSLKYWILIYVPLFLFSLQASNYAALIQLAPILLIIFLSFFSSLLVSDPIYSLQATT